MKDFISKPVKKDKLMIVLSKWLKNFQKRISIITKTDN